MAEELGTYYNATQLSQALGVSRSAIFSLARRGALPPGVKVGHARRWAVSDVKQALKGATVQND